jgi:hypothetical protein
MELDGIGGNFLARASLHRQGVIFPGFAVDHQLETEGLAQIARLSGARIVGLPNLAIVHKLPEQPFFSDIIPLTAPEGKAEPWRAAAGIRPGLACGRRPIAAKPAPPPAEIPVMDAKLASKAPEELPLPVVKAASPGHPSRPKLGLSRGRFAADSKLRESEVRLGTLPDSADPGSKAH